MCARRMSRSANAERVLAKAQKLARSADYTEADGRALGEVKTEHLLAGIVLVKGTKAYKELVDDGTLEPILAQLRTCSTINERDLVDEELGEERVSKYDPFAGRDDLPLSENAKKVVVESKLFGLVTEEMLVRLREHGVAAKIIAAAVAQQPPRPEAGEAKAPADAAPAPAKKSSACGIS